MTEEYSFIACTKHACTKQIGSMEESISGLQKTFNEFRHNDNKEKRLKGTQKFLCFWW